MASETDSLIQKLRCFAKDRDWEKFHSPKNLAMAVSVEAAELLEHFQWLTEQQSYQLTQDKKQDVAYEMADILLYLLRLADQLEINLIDSAHAKMSLNDNKYPAEQVRGRADKYTAYSNEE